jgi:hypothetical protein
VESRPSSVEKPGQQITRLATEIARLSEMRLAPADYYREFLQRVLMAMAAQAGAVWLRTLEGDLRLQCQVNMREVGLDKTETGRQSHDELLRQAVMRAQPGILPPHTDLGSPEGNAPSAGNPTDFGILLAPILVEKQVAGLVEVWLDARRVPDSQRGYLQFMVRMAGIASGFAARAAVAP